MMKKTYISPQSSVVSIAPKHLFCASGPVLGVSLPQGKASEEYETLSRSERHRDWEDDEDYEDEE